MRFPLNIWAFLLLTCPLTSSQDRPNILWLTFEDTSASEFGCYGNPYLKTPVIDEIAKNGIQFLNASSNAPQCSPARSTIISGQYSTTFGSDWHRRHQNVPHEIYYFTRLLRAAGYFCTNNTKQDYNNTKTPDDVWDVADRSASYNHPDRKIDQPFFSVFNANLSHMGRIRSYHTEERRDFSKEGIFEDELGLPSHLPDLSEIRSDYAFHLEGTQDIDRWVALCLDDLEANGFSEDTIVFIFSDHGGCLPRGKGFLYQSGLQVPFLVHFPEKWKHLANGLSGMVKDLVGFVDLAPTVLGLAGIPSPAYFQGVDIFGEDSLGDRKYQFGFRCNQEHHFDPVRSVFDGRYKYIRNFIPRKTYSLRNFYQWGMPANQAWDRWVLKGNRDPVFQPRPTHELYDTAKDPDETKNLALDEGHQEILKELEQALIQNVQQTKDLGFFPQTMREKDIPLYHWVRNTDYDLERLWKLCFMVGETTEEDSDTLLEAIRSEDPLLNYWGSIAIANSNVRATSTTIDQLERIAHHSDPFVAAAASNALIYQDDPEAGLQSLLYQFLENDSMPAYSHLEAITWSHHADTLASALKKAETELEEIYPNNQPLRSIAINLKVLSYDELYPESSYQEGVNVNKHRRPLRPLP